MGYLNTSYLLQNMSLRAFFAKQSQLMAESEIASPIELAQMRRKASWQ